MAQWNPFDELTALQRQLEQAFAHIGGRADPPFQTAFLPGRAARDYPLCNLHEDRDRLYLEALAPGLDPASLTLTVVRTTLTLSGEKPRVLGEVKPEAVHRSERAAGNFVRTIELPVEVDEAQVTAEYKNGLLLVTLPKTERAKPRQITVHVA